MQELITQYKHLVNDVLPATFTYPVRFNHCFARIVLDWLFGDCWYNHLSSTGPAVHQLTDMQLEAAITRMHQWLQQPSLLVADNNASLRYRREHKQPH